MNPTTEQLISAEPSTPATPPTPRRVSLSTVIGLSVTGLCLAGIATVVILALPLITADPVELNAVQRPVYAEPSPGADPVQVASQPSRPPAPPIAGQPLALSLPAVGLSASVGAMTVPRSGQIDPPTPGSGYWIRDYGTVGPDSRNTAYIAGHTFRGGHGGVFNKLFDAPTDTALVHKGDKVLVKAPEGTYSYTITSTALYDKVTLDQQSALWAQVPGRLALVTCFQLASGAKATQNFVIYAQLDRE